MKLRIASLTALLALGFGILSTVQAADDGPTSRPAAKALLGNKNCPICGQPANPESFVTYTDEKKGIHARIYLVDDEAVKMAKGMNQEELKKLYEDAYLKDKDGKTVEYGKTVRDAGNKTCPVSSEPTEGEVVVNYNATAINFCCPGCDEQFLADPDKFLNNIRDEIEKDEEG